MRTWPVVIREVVTETDRCAVARWYGETRPGRMATVRRTRAFLKDHGVEGLNEAIRSMEAQDEDGRQR